MTAAEVLVEQIVGTAAEFHARPMPAFDRPEVWVFDITGSAVVLGSTQRSEVVDSARAGAAGVEVVRRHSGGGAVWLEPGAVTWLDVLLPAEHPRWAEDVSRSAIWLGRALAEGMAAADGSSIGPVVVHEGELRRGPWSDLVCFAGLAAGEASIAGAKVLGISQRRSRAGARFQCAVLHSWDPRPLLDVLDLAGADRAAALDAVAVAAVGVGTLDRERLVGAVVDALTVTD